MNSRDQVGALIVDAQGRFIDFDGDDLVGVSQPGLNASADDLGAPAFTDRLTDASIDPSIGSVGDVFDNALPETVIGLFKQS